jgi:hypothetical protein
MAEEFDDAEFAEEELADDLDPADLDEELDVDLDDEAFVLDDAVIVSDDEVIVEEEDDLDDRGPRVVVVGTEEEDDDEDLVDPDDVEADLDSILKDRMVAADDDAPDDDEDEAEVDDRGDPLDRIAPKRPGEFVCQSCFLLKSANQLADAASRLCADCV